MLQQIYEEGLYHPSVTTSITSSLFYPYNFSTTDVLAQNASKQAGYICTCGEFYDNPCRQEIRAVSYLLGDTGTSPSRRPVMSGCASLAACCAVKV